MPGQLTPDQLNDLVDVIGGLYGGSQEQQPVEQDPAPPQEPTPPPAPEPAPQQQAPAPQQPAVPQQPALPAPQQPQQAKVRPSPFADHWHKALPFQTKARRGRRVYTPTVANAPKPPDTKPTKPPSVPTVGSLIYNARPQRPPAAQPFEQAQTPSPEIPQDQAGLLVHIQQEANKKGGEQVGTNLAHVIRTRMVDPSIASQYQAASVFSLDELTHILNEGHRAEPQEEIDLAEYHDDTSPFVILSHPRQTLTQGGAPAVVVGEPYASLVHQLEAAFPGVHFFPANEAPSELQRSASQVAKPLPVKRLLISPYSKHFRRIGTKDENARTDPLPDPAVPKPQSRTTPAAPAPARNSPAQPKTEFHPPPSQSGSENLPPLEPLPRRSHSRNRVPPGWSQIQPVVPLNAPRDPEANRGTIPYQTEQGQSPTPGEDIRPLIDSLDPNDFDSKKTYLEAVAQAALELAQSQGMASDRVAYFQADAVDKAEKKWKEFLQEAQRHQGLLEEGSDPSYWSKVGRTDIGNTLKNGKVAKKTLIAEPTSGVSYQVEYEDGTKGIFKPAALEGRGQLAGGRTASPRYSISRTTFYKREVLASYAARLFGIEHLVPETVQRSIDKQVGSVQHWIEGTKPASHYFDTGSDEMWDGDDLAYLAALDYVFANTDRNTGNWLITREGRLVGIDHGLSLPGSTLDITASAKIRAMEILRHAAYPGNTPGATTPAQQINVSVKATTVPNLYHWKMRWRDLITTARKFGIEEDALKLAQQRLFTLVKYGGKSFADVPAPDESGVPMGEWFPQVESPDYQIPQNPRRRRKKR